MRADRKPWSVLELREHEKVGGPHRERAVKYGLQRLEQQGLIERCNVPVEKRKKGRPVVYYQATGTDVPKAYSKRAVRYIPPESVSLIENDCTGTDLNKNTGLSLIDPVFNQDGSTPPGACSTEPTRWIKNTAHLRQSDDDVKKPSTGTDLNKNMDTWVNRQIAQSRWDD